jgi:cell wall-associated NlpC family hydrolase
LSSPVHAQAVDIVSVDGQPVGPNNFAARDLVTEIAALDPSVRPDEIGTPWPIQSPGFFSDPSSAASLHLAFEMPGTGSGAQLDYAVSAQPQAPVQYAASSQAPASVASAASAQPGGVAAAATNPAGTYPAASVPRQAEQLATTGSTAPTAGQAPAGQAPVEQLVVPGAVQPSPGTPHLAEQLAAQAPGAFGTPVDPAAMAKVQAMVNMADSLLGKPYIFGGGHASWAPSPGYDCSGFVSTVLHAGGYLSEPVDTTNLPEQAGILTGPGRIVTIYDRAQPGEFGHVIISINGQFYESGGSAGPWGGGGGVEKIGRPSAAYLATFPNVLHPEGL